MPIKITDENYQLYKSVFAVLCKPFLNAMPNMPADAHPVQRLTSWESKNKARAKQGLKMGLNEMIAILHEFPPETLKEMDVELKADGLPGIGELLSAVTKTISAVLKRKKIKNLTEFYMIKEIVIDQASNITDQQREALDKYLVEFEFGKASGQNS